MEKIELSTILYYLALVIQWTTLVVVVLRYPRLKSRFTFFFLLFMVATCLMESIGWYYWKVLRMPSAGIYNIYTFFEFNLLTFMYLSIIQEKRSLRVIQVLNLVFNTFYILSFLNLSLQKYNVIIESMVLSVFCITYFKQLLASDEILNYKRNLPFWISCGFFIFYLSSIPFQIIRESLDNRNMFFIQMFLIYIMHAAFIYGLLWSKKET